MSDPTPPGNVPPGSVTAPEEILAGATADLLDAIAEVLGPWVVGSVERRWHDYTGDELDASLRGRAEGAATEARATVLAALTAVLAADAEQQRTGPLDVLRRAVSFPTVVLREAGVPPVVRDRFAERTFPDDDYDLTPAAFADIDPALHEPGLMWGAAKAHVVLSRRRPRP